MNRRALLSALAVIAVPPKRLWGYINKPRQAKRYGLRHNPTTGGWDLIANYADLTGDHVIAELPLAEMKGGETRRCIYRGLARETIEFELYRSHTPLEPGPHSALSDTFNTEKFIINGRRLE